MKKVLMILSLTACICVFCFLAIGYAAVQDTLTVSGSVSVDSYKIVYHTYSAAEGKDITTVQGNYASPSDEVTIAGVPDGKNASDFLGWTFSGVYTDFQSNISVYIGGETVTLQDLMSKQGGTGKEVHLYDVCKSYPTLTAELHPQDKIVGSEANSANTPFTFKSKISDSAGTREYEAKTDSNAAISFVSRKDGKAYTLYYHPGVQVQVVGGSVSGTKAYVTKNSTDKTSTVTAYETLASSGNTMRYVGLDFTPSNTKIVYYHSYNGEGDYVLDYDEYFGDSAKVTVRAASSNANSYVASKTWRCWSLNGIVAATEADNVNEYSPGNTESFSALYTEQAANYTVTLDGVSVSCIRFLDIYASTAKIIAQALPADYVSTGHHKTMFNVGISFEGKTLQSARTGDDSGLWNITSTSQQIVFYYHPGIVLHSQTGSGRTYYYADNSTKHTSDVWQTLNKSAPLTATGYEWTSPNTTSSSEQSGTVDTNKQAESNNLKITSRYDQNVTLTYDGTINIYDVDDAPENSKSSEWSESECFAAGTLVTLADGRRVPVEELSSGDILRVYDHENGRYTCAPILFIEYDGIDEYNVINLVFSDGTNTKLIYEHGLFDLDLNKYVYITEANYADLIGHRFAKESDSGYGIVTLEDAYVESEVIGCYSLTTNYYQNYFIDGMFSMPGGITGLFNYFEYGENLEYDQEKMQADIEKYGLYTAEDFAEYLPEEVFNEIYPVKYLKVSVGKGLMTFEDIVAIIERYVYGHDLT